MSLISYAGCLGLSRVFSAKIHSLTMRRSLKSRKIHYKPPIVGVQGRWRSSTLVPTESSSYVLVMISSKSVSICKRSDAREVDSSRNRAFWMGCPNLMLSYGGLLEHRGSKLALLKPMLKILCAGCLGSIYSNFGAFHFRNVSLTA